MKIHIEAPVTKVKIEKALELITEKKMVKRGNLTKHFGALKRGIDGLDYQKKVRNEWG